MRSANAYPTARLTPGMKRARQRATWSNVLWSSLRTITRHSPPRPLPGPSTRGSSTVWLTAPRLAVPQPSHGREDRQQARQQAAQDLRVAQALGEHRADDLADRQGALIGRLRRLAG